MIRRSLLLLALLLPLATSRAADAPPAGPETEFAFEEIVTIGAAVPVGRTPRGTRQFIPIAGGRFEGPRIRGKVLPGGWDWQLIRPDGHIDIDASYFIQADDGAVIHVHNRGTLFKRSEGVYDIKTFTNFEAPLGPHQWLNEQSFVGTLGGAPASEGPAVRIRFFRVK